MNKEEIEALADSWIKATEAGLGPNGNKGNDNLNWAVEKMLDIPYKEPELAWEIIITIIKKNPSPKVISQLGAGPLEDIMRYHGNNFMKRVEKAVVENALFKDCMKSVWLDEDDLDSYIKFYELAEIVPPFVNKEK